MSTQTPDPEVAARLDWMRRVRGLHRNKRMIGFAGILLGACMLVWWRLDERAPEWAFWAGLALLLANWALFVFVILARWRWVKAHPYQGP